MAGAGGNELVMDEWRASDPSPRTFFSNRMNGDLSSKPFFTDARADNGGEPGITAPAKEDNEAREGVSGDPCSESDVVSAQKPASRASLAERMAARTGFNAPKLDTDSIRSTSLPSPSVRSPYLTIPPGLSPTTLLESPVFLSNSLTQQSPTTGKFPFGPFEDGGLLASSYAFEKGKDSSLAVAPAPFAFRPPPKSSSLCFTNGENRIAAVPTTRHQSLPSIEVSVQSAGQIPNQNLSTTKTYSQNDREFCSLQSLQTTPSSKDIISSTIPQNAVNNVGNTPPFDDEDDGDQKGDFSSRFVGSLAEDGYNWRKYGQKQVKGSEFPRSYYKCTHMNCPVKKKVERSHEGHVSEIIYKGAHNHPKPTPNRRSDVGSYQTLDEGDNNVMQQSLEGENATWTLGQHGISNGRVDWMMNEGTNNGPSGSSASAEFCDPPLSIHGPGGVETAEATDVSSTMSNENDDDDRATNASVSLGCEGEEEESESKRRKLDVCVSEISGATRAIREPRVVVQTTSEVDILDDGYRWRKYGQKVVKGNPNPRSYYKCTNAGCIVRKHVERASHDLKSVITTYEGKHNHDVPAARNSSHINSTPSVSSAAPASSSSLVPRAEPSQTHGSLHMFDPSPVFSAFNMHGRTQMTAPIPGYSFGMGQANLSSIAMVGLGSANNGKLPGFPMPHPYLGQQQHQHQQSLRKPNEWGLMMPKGEPNELPLESDLPVTNASAAYHQLMNRMALGPQL